MSVEMNDTYTKVASIVAEILSIDKTTITPETTFEKLGADSLDKLEIIMKLEEAFGIEINDEQAAKLTTLAEAVQKINTLRAK